MAGGAVDEGAPPAGCSAAYPGFVLRNGLRMCAHTFRGSSWRSVLGLEGEREVFRRYKPIRAAEREYIAEGPPPRLQIADCRLQTDGLRIAD